MAGLRGRAGAADHAHRSAQTSTQLTFSSDHPAGADQVVGGIVVQAHRQAADRAREARWHVLHAPNSGRPSSGRAVASAFALVKKLPVVGSALGFRGRLRTLSESVNEAQTPHLPNALALRPGRV